MRTPWLIGNDVVDLRDAGAVGAASRSRFVARVCTAAERHAVAAAASPDRMLWTLWAAKEAAFKALRKADGGIGFIPRSFEVALPPSRATQAPALVRHRLATLSCSIQATDDYVHAICLCGAGDERRERVGELHAEVRELPEGLEEGSGPGRRRESVGARRLLEELALSRAGLRGQVVREDGLPPRLRCESANRDVDVSLSHDGRFAAAALYCCARRAGTPAP